MILMAFVTASALTEAGSAEAPIPGCLDVLQHDQGATSLPQALQDHPEWSQNSRTPDSTVQTAGLPATWTSPLNGVAYRVNWLSHNQAEALDAYGNRVELLLYNSRTGVFTIIPNDPTPCEPQRREPHRSHRE